MLHLSKHRVAIFMLSTISPLHIAILKHLSNVMDISVYVLNPCREFWFDITNNRTTLKQSLSKDTQISNTILYCESTNSKNQKNNKKFLENNYLINSNNDNRKLEFDNLSIQYTDLINNFNNSLLAEWGKQSQELLLLLFDLNENNTDFREEIFIEQNNNTLLSSIQNAILNLKPLPTITTDILINIEVHICCSLFRQLQVLHDKLLDFFSKDSSITPDNILIVLPTISNAAPLINAVFNTYSKKHYIPYKIYDPNIKVKTNCISNILISWLNMFNTSFGITELINWLKVEALSKTYNINISELENIQNTLLKAGMRVIFSDEEQIIQQHNSKSFNYTLDDALTRISIGCIMPDFSLLEPNLLPITNNNCQNWLGGLIQFCEDFKKLRIQLATIKLVYDWQFTINWIIYHFFTIEPLWIDEFNALVEASYETFNILASSIDNTILISMPVSINIINQALIRTLNKSLLNKNIYISNIKNDKKPILNSVTFTDLSSLRFLPYKIICLLDIDHISFPSSENTEEFDLTSTFKRLHDYNLYNDELNLFLDIILACRQFLYISYTGKNIKNNLVLPSSSLVDNLLNYCAQIIAGPEVSIKEIALAREKFITLHPLQPFSEKYFFLEKNLFTYNHDFAEIRSILNKKQSTTFKLNCSNQSTTNISLHKEDKFFVKTIFNSKLPSIIQDKIEFSLFKKFWCYPQTTLLKERLGITFNRNQKIPKFYELYNNKLINSKLEEQKILYLLLENNEIKHNKLNNTFIYHNNSNYNESLLQYITAKINVNTPYGTVGSFIRKHEVNLMLNFLTRVTNSIGNNDKLKLHFHLSLLPHWPNLINKDIWLKYTDIDIDDIIFSPLTVNGTIDGITKEGRIAWYFNKSNASALIAIWLEHLIFNSLDNSTLQNLLNKKNNLYSKELLVSRKTYWITKTNTIIFNPVSNAKQLLNELVTFYRIGLTYPLPFFPKSAYAYSMYGKLAALRQFEGNKFSKGERNNISICITCGKEVKLTPIFQLLSQLIFQPLIDHINESYQENI